MALASLQPGKGDRACGFARCDHARPPAVERSFERLSPDEEHQEKHRLGRRPGRGLLGLGSACAWADELAQQPPAPPPPMAPAPAAAPTPPPPGAPAAATAPGPTAPGPTAPGPTAAAAPAPAPAAPTSPLIAPTITGPLTIQLPPPKYTLPRSATSMWTASAAVSASGRTTRSPATVPGARPVNGQVFVQKTDGIFQFYAQAGAYSIAALGSPYFPTAQATFGYHSPVGQFVGLVSAGLCQDRADQQFLGRGRQAAHPDRRRIHVLL